MVQEFKEFTFALDHSDAEGANPTYATNLIIQYTGQEFIVTFFYAQPPLLVGGSQEEIYERAAKTRSVRAKCVAKLIVSLDRMEQFATVFQQSLKRLEGGKQAEEESNG